MQITQEFMQGMPIRVDRHGTNFRKSILTILKHFSIRRTMLLELIMKNLPDEDPPKYLCQGG